MQNGIFYQRLNEKPRHIASLCFRLHIKCHLKTICIAKLLELDIILYHMHFLLDGNKCAAVTGAELQQLNKCFQQLCSIG